MKQNLALFGPLNSCFEVMLSTVCALLPNIVMIMYLCLLLYMRTHISYLRALSVAQAVLLYIKADIRSVSSSLLLIESSQDQGNSIEISLFSMLWFTAI
jgi:hypothetical protein